MIPGTVTPTLTPAQILAHLNALGTSGALFDASVFALKDPSAPTKIGKFSAAGITAGQTRTYTLPDATGTVPLLGLAQTWSATQTFGAIDATSIGATTRGTGLFTTLGANGVASLTNATAATSTSTGALVVTGGAGIGGALYVGGVLNVAGAATMAAVAATTVSASGQITSTVATGTAPLVIASTTVVGNLNVSQLLGATWNAPGTIGSGTPSTGAFTTLSSSGLSTLNSASVTTTLGVTGAATLSSTLAVTGTSTFTGAAGFGGGGVSTFAPVAVQGFSGITGTTAIGVFVNAATPSTATSAVRGAQFSLTGAASTTHAEATGFLCAGIAPGAGGTLTRVQAAWLNPQSASGTNTCGLLISSAMTYTGAWAIRSEATEASYLAGALTVASSTDSTSTTTGAVVVSGGVGIAKGLSIGNGAKTGAGTWDEANGFTELIVGRSGTSALTNTTCAFVGWLDATHPLNVSGVNGELLLYSRQAGTPGMSFCTANTGRMHISALGSIVLGTRAALATNATDGFAYMPSCAGTPTGAPTAYTGKVAWCYDSTNHIIYIHDGAWKKTAALT